MAKRKPKNKPEPTLPPDMSRGVRLSLIALRNRYNTAGEHVKRMFSYSDVERHFIKSMRESLAKVATATEDKISNSVHWWFMLGIDFAAAMAPVIHCREHLGYDPRYQNPDTTPLRSHGNN